MAVKRASFRIPDEAIAEAAKLRGQGWSYPRIADHLGYAMSAIYNRLKDVQVTESPEALDADDAQLASDTDQAVRDTLAVYRGAVASLAQRITLESKALAKAAAATPDGVPAKLPKRTWTARDLGALESGMIELRKQALLARGKPTSRSETIVRRAEPELTPEERAALDGLKVTARSQ